MKNKPNPEWTSAKHGDIVASGFDEESVFFDRWDDDLGRAVRFRPSKDQPKPLSKPGELWTGESWTGDWQSLE